MRYLVVFLLTITIVSVVRAETYEWVDSAGVTHFTDDLDRVPTKYRSKIKERESVKSEEPRSAPVSQPAPAADKPSVQAQREIYGGHDEAWWRFAFKSLRDELKTLQDRLPGEKEQLTAIHRRRVIFQKPSDREAYNKLNQDITNDEARIKELQVKLDALDLEAVKADVPMEWRQ